MFDIGWSEMLVVAVVMILVVGPRDLPGMLRAFGRTLGQLRRTANEFKSQFDDALKEAELDEARRKVEGIGKIDPLTDVRKELSDLKSEVKKPLAEPKAGVASPKGATGTDAAPADAAKEEVSKTEAEPAKQDNAA